MGLVAPHHGESAPREEQDIAVSASRTLMNIQIDLDGADASDRLREGRQQLDMMRWYLYFQLLERFFEQWPQIRSLEVDVGDEGEDEPALPYFFDKDWAQGAKDAASDEDQEALAACLEILGEQTHDMADGGILSSINAMTGGGVVRADKLMDSFARWWAEDKDDPAAARKQWAAMVARIQSTRLNNSVDDASHAGPRPAARM